MAISAEDSHEQKSRYVVGLDLGTTNSAMAYLDTQAESPALQTFHVTQVVSPSVFEARETLPSFLYQPAAGEFPQEAMRLPWQKTESSAIVGWFAREQGTLVPSRLIGSAKSWLCHGGVDRTADLLPWQGAADVQRMSPVAASSHYLSQYREAWDYEHPQHPLSEQDFILTIPASFDEVARELTLRAAQLAGLRRVYLIEEPQAAFYAWIDKHSDQWNELVTPGQTILVCDIGGGTSDFTLIRVRQGSDGLVQFHRVAVGNHLILGGDNFDLALAHSLERKLKGEERLEPRAWSVLVRSCRQVKESLLGANPPESMTVTLPSGGSRLIGGGLQVEVTRDEAMQIVLDGFFPRVSLEDRPTSARSGFQEFGLPYTADSAITRYLAAFLSAHRYDGVPESERQTVSSRPDLLLFNGGVFEAAAIRARVIEQLHSWFQKEDPNWTLTVLDNERLDLAVARGAAYYGRVRRGEGVRISAGLARTYYVGVDVDDPATGLPAPAALCLCPAGMEPGDTADLSDRTFELRLAEPIELPLFVSSTRLTDQSGELIKIDREQLTPLPPIRTVFKSGKAHETGSVRVNLHARLTEIGTLDLWCKDLAGAKTWKLLFDVRSVTETDRVATAATANEAGVLDDRAQHAAEQEIRQTFQTGESEPSTLMRRLSDAIELSRQDWPPTLMRQMWETLQELDEGRWRSPQHEARWLNLTGFCLRPGYGLAVDDWRVSETWKRLQGKLVHASANVRVEWWILWRRIAGGLTAGQQQSLMGLVLPLVKTAGRGKLKSRGSQVSPHELSEQCRLLGALEWLSPPSKVQIGDLMLSLAASSPHEPVRSAAVWSLGRIGARWPVYGPLNTIVEPEIAARWIRQTDQLPGENSMESFALMQLARMTGDRYRDVSKDIREHVVRTLQRLGADPHFLELVQSVAVLEQEEQGTVFGDELPKGLRIL